MHASVLFVHILSNESTNQYIYVHILENSRFKQEQIIPDIYLVEMKYKSTECIFFIHDIEVYN